MRGAEDVDGQSGRGVASVPCGAAESHVRLSFAGEREEADRESGFRSAVWKLGAPTTAEELRPLHPTMLHALAAAAEHTSVGITLLAEDEDVEPSPLTYSMLAQSAQRLARVLARDGVGPGDRVLIVLPTSLDFLISFFAVQYLGAVPVPSYPPASLEQTETALQRLGHIANHCGAAWCITNGTLCALLGVLAHDTPSLRRILTVEKLRDQDAVEIALPEVTPASIAFIQYTSGSTGAPKGVVITHASVCANAHAIGVGSRINRDDVMVTWLPLYHDMGLVGGFLFPLFFHIPIVMLAPTTFLMAPVRWLRAIHEFKGTLSPAPNFAFSLCTRRVSESERDALDLSSWRLCFNGAEPVNRGTVVEFERVYRRCGLRPGSMFPVYGLAESVLAVSFPRPGDAISHEDLDRRALASGRAIPSKEAGAVTVVSVGRPLPGHEVVIADDAGRTVPSRTIGQVLVRGPSLMQGYYGAKEATARVLRRGWLATGDLGYQADGHLFITGRRKDMLIVRGQNYYAEDIEWQAERVAGVRPGGVVAFGVYDEAAAIDRAVLVCETRVDASEHGALREAITNAVSETTGLVPSDVVLVPSQTIPKTSSGKRQRPRTKELYLAGELRARKKTGRLGLASVIARSAIGRVALVMRRNVSVTTRGDE